MKIKSLPPGVIIVQHESEQALEDFLNSFTNEEIEELGQQGYHVIAMSKEYKLTHLTDEQLNSIGLQRVRPRKVKKDVSK